VENFGWNFSANDYSEPEDVVLSSGAMVTAAETVQNAREEIINGKGRRDLFVEFSFV
jgi:hypothetical protein